MSLGTAAETQSDSPAEGRITDSVPSFLPAGDNSGRAEEEVSDGSRQEEGDAVCLSACVCALGQGAAGCVDGGVRQGSTRFSGQRRSSAWSEAERTVEVKVPRLRNSSSAFDPSSPERERWAAGAPLRGITG